MQLSSSSSSKNLMLLGNKISILNSNYETNVKVKLNRVSKQFLRCKQLCKETLQGDRICWILQIVSYNPLLWISWMRTIDKKLMYLIISWKVMEIFNQQTRIILNFILILYQIQCPIGKQWHILFLVSQYLRNNFMVIMKC